LTIPEATVLGVADEILEPLVGRINAGNGSESGLTTIQQSTRKKHSPVSEVVKRKLDHL
jgi:hypothetical protein